MLKLHPELYNVCKYVTHVMFHLFLSKQSINLMYLMLRSIELVNS